MADHRALGKLGWVFGAVTAAVLLTAAMMVTSRADQRPSQGATHFAAAPPSAGAYEFANLFHPQIGRAHV